MNDLEIAWAISIEDNLPEIAAWANKQGGCVTIDDEGDENEIIYTTAAATMCSDFVDD